MGRDAGVTDAALQKMEDDCKRLEAMSAELDRIQEEYRRKSEKAHGVLDDLKQHTKEVKRVVKAKYDQTWWTKFGIPDKR